MRRIVGRLADRALSVFVPQATAMAAHQTQCVACTSGRQLWQRDCINGVCEPWGLAPGPFCNNC